MKLSIIIPAYNEAKRIPSCLESVSRALEVSASPTLATEVIVVDNNSTDGTGDLARRAGAQVLFEPHNQIARARNVGAQAASGDWFLFLDADTLINSGSISEMLDYIRSNKFAGGGTIIRFDRLAPLIRPLAAAGNLLIRCSKLTCGCFIFCRSEAFRDIGGFNEALFAAEDAAFGYSLKRWAAQHHQKLAILRRHPPITSSRKLELYSPLELTRLFLRLIFRPKSTMRNKQHLHVFYDGRR